MILLIAVHSFYQKNYEVIMLAVRGSYPLPSLCQPLSVCRSFVLVGSCRSSSAGGLTKVLVTQCVDSHGYIPYALSELPQLLVRGKTVEIFRALTNLEPVSGYQCLFCIRPKLCSVGELR